jgi:hypothetical protein
MDGIARAFYELHVRVDIEISARAGVATGPLGFGIGRRAGLPILGLYAGIDVIHFSRRNM